jgi:hypothetical protein
MINKIALGSFAGSLLVCSAALCANYAGQVKSLTLPQGDMPHAKEQSSEEISVPLTRLMGESQELVEKVLGPTHTCYEPGSGRHFSAEGCLLASKVYPRCARCCLPTSPGALRTKRSQTTGPSQRSLDQQAGSTHMNSSLNSVGTCLKVVDTRRPMTRPSLLVKPSSFHFLQQCPLISAIGIPRSKLVHHP